MEAFLRVPLYKAIYDKYRGFTLPPQAALEREMALLGVTPKQTDKARQAFERSAAQAGFFWAGKDRLVMPSMKGGQSEPAPSEPRPLEPGSPGAPSEKPAHGGGGGGGNDLHPFIAGLLASLPPAKVGQPKPEWPIAEQAKWLQTAASIFTLMYESSDGRIKVEQDG